MLIAEAGIETDRASRYLVQLCRHASQMGRRLHRRPRTHGGGDAPTEVQHVKWTDTHGMISFGWGRCILQATPDTLTVRAEAADEESLRRIQDGVAARLERIGRRDCLKVDWQRSEAPTAPPAEATGTPPAPEGGAAARRRRGRTIGLSAVGIVVVTMHLGLGGAALESSRWTDWATNVVLAVVLLKVIALAGHVALGRLAIRRGKASKAR